MEPSFEPRLLTVYLWCLEFTNAIIMFMIPFDRGANGSSRSWVLSPSRRCSLARPGRVGETRGRVWRVPASSLKMGKPRQQLICPEHKLIQGGLLPCLASGKWKDSVSASPRGDDAPDGQEALRPAPLSVPHRTETPPRALPVLLFSEPRRDAPPALY